mgnify:CR=1 FL=1
MKLKDLLFVGKNISNNQSNWNPKKRVLKRIKLSEEDILEMKISKKILEKSKNGKWPDNNPTIKKTSNS